jgi:tetratricopeptide (TPR) repeat protein
LHSHLSFANAKLGKEREAIASADTAILQSADLNRLGYRLSKIQVLTILGRTDEALALGGKLLEEFPGAADRLRIRYQLSGVYSAARKHAEAERELRAILDADPDHKWACNDLGYHLADQGRNLDEAERLIRHAIAVDRIDRKKSGDFEHESASHLDSLAWVLFRRGRMAEARDLLEKVAAMPDGSTDGVVWDHLGDVRYRLGDKNKARAAWEEAGKLLAEDARGKRDGRLDDVKRKLKRLP